VIASAFFDAFKASSTPLSAFVRGISARQLPFLVHGVDFIGTLGPQVAGFLQIKISGFASST
jgi:hypothetical protein